MLTLKFVCPLVGFEVSRPLRDPEMDGEEWEDYLRGFDLDLVFGLDLFEGLVLRRFLRDDFEFEAPFLKNCFSVLFSADFALEKRVRVEDESDFERIKFNVERILRNAVLALRLLKEGCFSADFVFCFLVVLEEKNKLKSWTWFRGQKLRARQLIYSFSIVEIPMMNRLLKNIYSADFERSEGLNLVCKKFQRALEEDNLKDQIADLLSAFEILFKNKEETNNMAAKIAVACSQLLREDDEEEREIRSVLDEAYRIRNQMINGSESAQLEEDSDYISDVISRTRDYLRLTIKSISQGLQCSEPH